MENKELKALQDELDVMKWNDTQARGGQDTCGTYDYCVKCDKSTDFPCARAKTVFEAVAVAEAKPAKKAKPVSDKAIRTRKTTRSKKAE